MILGELIGSSFEQTWIPFTQGCFVPSLVEIGPVVLEKKMKMWKVYRQTDRQTDGRTDGQTDAGRQVIRKAHLSFQLRWAKNIIYSSKEFCIQFPDVLRCTNYIYILRVLYVTRRRTQTYFNASEIVSRYNTLSNVCTCTPLEYMVI